MRTKPKLTTHQQQEVTRMFDEGHSTRTIAKMFNVGVATIQRVKEKVS